MPISTRRAPAHSRPSSRRRRQSDRRLVVTATFTTSAPVASIALTRPERSFGMPLKSCSDSTTPVPRRRRTRSEKPADHSTSTYSAPRTMASSRIACRSGSLPPNRPPSRAERHVTTTGPRRPSSAAATSGDSTRSRRSSTRSASVAASSRPARRPSIVRAATVEQMSGRLIGKEKASSTPRLKRLGSGSGRFVRVPDPAPSVARATPPPSGEQAGLTPHVIDACGSGWPQGGEGSGDHDPGVILERERTRAGWPLSMRSPRPTALRRAATP